MAHPPYTLDTSEKLGTKSRVNNSIKPASQSSPQATCALKRKWISAEFGRASRFSSRGQEARHSAGLHLCHMASFDSSD